MATSLMNSMRSACCALALLSLVACGGRGIDLGGHRPATPAPPSADTPSLHPLAGSWTDSNGHGQLFVAADGAVYGLRRGSDTNHLLRGTLAAADGQWLSGHVDAVDMLTPDTVQHWSVTGSFQPRSQLLLASNTAGPLMNAVYDALSERATDVALLPPSHDATVFGNNRTSTSYVATLSADGGVRLSNQRDGQRHCQVHGRLTAPSATLSILEASLVFAGDGCQFPSGTSVQGLAQYDPDNTSLTLFGMSENGDSAIVLYANPARP